jgi:hypothetical protein
LVVVEETENVVVADLAGVRFVSLGHSGNLDVAAALLGCGLRRSEVAALTSVVSSAEPWERRWDLP